MAIELAGDELAFSLIRRVEEIGARDALWPGFDPLETPLALYDGARTFLFGHPSPPEGFERVHVGPREAGLFDGRHSAIVANTCVEMGGAMVATLMLDSALSSLDLDSLAGIAIHEAFHVYQFGNPSVWPFANEADRFFYPVTDVDLMALRRQEIEALRRAIESTSLDAKMGWAKRAVRARQERFARMDTRLVEYERRTEKVEGLAAYVEAMAVRRTRVDNLDVNLAGDIRRTCYGVGHAMAALLDLTASDWKAEIESQVRGSLDEALTVALNTHADISERDFSTDEQDALFKAAREDVWLRLEERLQREEAFERRLGRRLILEALEHKPLWVTGMDPSNVHLVQREHGALHTRFLELRLEESRIEMMREGGIEVEALTESVGPNPVFDGIKRVEIVVSGGDWHVTETGGSLKILGEGVKADLRVSDWVKQGETLRVRLAS